MEIGKLLEMKRDDILCAADKHGASNIRVFGSVARGEAGPASDVDFLVKMDQGRSLIDLSNLVVDLQDLLGRKVRMKKLQATNTFSYARLGAILGRFGSISSWENNPCGQGEQLRAGEV